MYAIALKCDGFYGLSFCIFEECYEKEKNGLANEESRLHRDSFFSISYSEYVKGWSKPPLVM